jgi:hypothetical protein
MRSNGLSARLGAYPAHPQIVVAFDQAMQLPEVVRQRDQRPLQEHFHFAAEQEAPKSYNCTLRCVMQGSARL